MVLFLPRRQLRRKTKLIIIAVFLLVAVNFALFFTDSSNVQSEDDVSNLLGLVSLRPPFKVVTELPVFERDLRRNDSVLFTSVATAHAYMRHVTSLDDHKPIIIHYDSYERHLPRFINDSDRDYFLMSPVNRENLKPPPPEQLRGMIDVIANGTFQMEYTCGFGSDSSYFHLNRTSAFVKYYDHALVPLLIPMGFLFQHFFDGTFPKIVQAWEYIKRPDTKIILERPNHDNVYRILERLNITQEKVVWHRRNDVRTVYKAKYMINACVAPPMHPSLWRMMRRLLGVNDTAHLQQRHKKADVMLLTRAGASNGGRNALNMANVYTALLERFGERLVVFDSTHNLAQAMQVFQQVRVIIGTHGGAFYNLNYSPLNTTVIEFVPYDYGGRDIHALPHAIFWAMSDILGQTYWRVMAKSENYQHDVLMDYQKLSKILDQVEL